MPSVLTCSFPENYEPPGNANGHGPEIHSSSFGSTLFLRSLPSNTGSTRMDSHLLLISQKNFYNWLYFHFAQGQCDFITFQIQLNLQYLENFYMVCPVY